MGKSWQLQEAKNKFSEVIENAQSTGAQVVTRHGVKTAVILSFDDYQKLIAPKETLINFLKKSPLKGCGIDLERKKEFSRKSVF